MFLLRCWIHYSWSPGHRLHVRIVRQHNIRYNTIWNMIYSTAMCNLLRNPKSMHCGWNINEVILFKHWVHCEIGLCLQYWYTALGVIDRMEGEVGCLHCGYSVRQDRLEIQLCCDSWTKINSEYEYVFLWSFAFPLWMKICVIYTLIYTLINSMNNDILALFYANVQILQYYSTKVPV